MGGNRRAARHRVAVALVGAGIIVSIFWTVVPAPQRLLLHPPPAPGRPAIRRPPPKPLFRPEYSEALRDLQAMEAPEAAALESKLQNEPNNYRARLRLLAYCARADSGRRQAHTKWLIENDPASEILASPFIAKDGELAPAWERAVAAHPRDARVWWNAAQFYAHTNEKRYHECVERAVELDRANEWYGIALGGIYAEALFGGSGRVAAARAQDQLLKTNNYFVLEAATHVIQSRYIRTVMLDQPDTALRDLAARLFHRAMELDPGLDAEWVLPPIKTEYIGMLVRPQASPPPPDPAKMRRLRPSDFPELPGVVAQVLTARGCTIPQSRRQGRTNVIRGEFFEAGETGWAVVCSVRFQSELLVFRNDADDNPVRVGQRHPDAVMDDVCGTAITTVGRNYILRHYTGEGWPEPPSIDHQGIDDSIYEKASIVWYWHNGKWLQLQGAD